MRWFRDFFELFFPRLCSVCGTPLVGDEHDICTRCLLDLPEAISASNGCNFVEKRFIGRFPIVHATSLLIFTRNSKTQRIVHQIKYKGDKQLALSMGRLLGHHLSHCGLFNDVDLLVPVPLHPRKERHRGYNQSLLLCQGIAQSFPHPIISNNLKRTRYTESQTLKDRSQRLENMKDVFKVTDIDLFKNKHILLIDDVITTGATTEACCTPMLSIPGIRISIASLAVSGDS